MDNSNEVRTMKSIQQAKNVDKQGRQKARSCKEVKCEMRNK